MEINVRGTKVEITDSMRGYVTEKLGKLDKYISLDGVRANVLVKVRNYTQKVEVTIPLKTLILRAEAEEQDFYSAVDMVINKLERQIRKNKTKLQKREKKGIKELNVDEAIEIPEEKEVVKRKKIDLKLMSQEEAILQMDLLGHNFFLYKDEETDMPAVVYKRKDGGYGVIES